MDSIERVQGNTAKMLQAQKNQYCGILEKQLDEIKRKLKDEQAKKKESSANDFKEKERELTEHLETMTQIA